MGHGRSRDSEQTRYWPLHLTRRVALAAAGGASIRARLPDHSRTAVILACSALPGRFTGLAALPIVTTGLPAMGRPSDPPPVDSVTMVKTLRSSASAANGSNHYYLRGNAVLLSLLSISRTLPQAEGFTSPLPRIATIGCAAPAASRRRSTTPCPVRVVGTTTLADGKTCFLDQREKLYRKPHLPVDLSAKQGASPLLLAASGHVRPSKASFLHFSCPGARKAKVHVSQAASAGPIRFAAAAPPAVRNAFSGAPGRSPPRVISPFLLTRETRARPSLR